MNQMSWRELMKATPNERPLIEPPPLLNGKNESHESRRDGYQLWVKVPAGLAEIVPNLNIQTEFITPEKAVAMLEQNTRNRKSSKNRVDSYARQMAEKRWEFTGETITFDWDDVMLDGQQRLAAIRDSKIGVWCIVVRGLPPKARYAIGTGRAKTAADMFGMDGVKNSTAYATMSRMVLVYDKYDPTFGTHWESAGPDSNQVKHFGDAHPEFVRSVVIGVACSGKKLGSAGVAACCHHIFSRDNPELADQFLMDISEGDGLRNTSAAWHLRERLRDNRADPIAKLDKRYVLALFFKAWISYRAHKEMKLLRWAPESEAFPTL